MKPIMKLTTIVGIFAFFLTYSYASWAKQNIFQLGTTISITEYRDAGYQTGTKEEVLAQETWDQAHQALAGRPGETQVFPATVERQPFGTVSGSVAYINDNGKIEIVKGGITVIPSPTVAGGMDVMSLAKKGLWDDVVAQFEVIPMGANRISAIDAFVKATKEEGIAITPMARNMLIALRGFGGGAPTVEEDANRLVARINDVKKAAEGQRKNLLTPILNDLETQVTTTHNLIPAFVTSFMQQTTDGVLISYADLQTIDSDAVQVAKDYDKVFVIEAPAGETAGEIEVQFGLRGVQVIHHQGENLTQALESIKSSVDFGRVLAMVESQHLDTIQKLVGTNHTVTTSDNGMITYSELQQLVRKNV